MPLTSRPTSTSPAADAAFAHSLRNALGSVLGPAAEITRVAVDSFRDTEPGEVLPGVVRIGCCRISITAPSDADVLTRLYAVCVFDSIESLNSTATLPGPATALFGPSCIRLPALTAALFAFPRDPALPHLPDALTPEAVRSALGIAAERVESTPLKYDPGRGCTLRMTVHRADREPLELIAKTHHGTRLERTFGTMTRLAAAAESETWRFPRALAYDADRKVLWQEYAAGEPFWSAYSRVDARRVFQTMARAAAAMHATPFAPPGRHAELPDPAREARLLARAHPGAVPRHERLWRRLGAPPEAAAVSLHGDLHPNQFLIDGQRVALTDFDKACWGDAGFDVGCFASHVMLKAIEGDLALGALKDPIDGFFDAYHEAAPNIERRCTAWHTAAHLLGRRLRKLLVRDAGEGRVGHLLDLAEHWVERVERP